MLKGVLSMDNKLLVMLCALVTADCVLTTLAVGCLGFTEPNPVFAFCGGIGMFMVVKVIASAMCIVSMFVLYKSVPKAASVLVTALCLMYAVAVFGGAIVIIWTVI